MDENLLAQQQDLNNCEIIVKFMNLSYFLSLISFPISCLVFHLVLRIVVLDDLSVKREVDPGAGFSDIPHTLGVYLSVYPRDIAEFTPLWVL